MFLISSILFFTVKLIFSNQMTIETLPTLITILCFIVSPFVHAILYAKNPKKVSNKQPTMDTVFVSLIVVFNLILITFAGNLLFGVDFSDVKTILFSLIFPSIIFVLVVTHFLIRFFVSKNRICKITSKSPYKR